MRQYRKLFLGIICLMLAAFVCSSAFAAKERTIIGTVNGEGKLVADDGAIYEIGESGKGIELLEMSGKKVNVTGTVAESEGTMTIEVLNFNVLE